MGVDRGVSRCASEILVLAVGNVLPRSHVAVLLCQTEIDQEEFVAVSPDTHEKIVRLK